jgi:hypothetical protein
MAAFWREQVRQRRIVTPAPARVRWQWAASDIAAPRAHVVTPPVPGAGPATPGLTGSDAEGVVLSSGVVTRLHEEVYQRLPHRLLVILGDPGAGKTAAMILLLLAALDHRSQLTGEQRRCPPVPVWLTLGGWNPATTPLRQWARDTLNRDHPYLRAAEHGPDAAGRLLRAGRVALFLDGLDEMSEDVRGRALDRLREEAAGLWVVVTSRTGQYRQAVAAGQLDNAAVIELRPVRARAAADYLLHGQTGPQHARWQQVCAYLREHPGARPSGPPPGRRGVPVPARRTPRPPRRHPPPTRVPWRRVGMIGRRHVRRRGRGRVDGSEPLG